MQIRTIRKDSKHSNANLNHSKGIRSIWMQIRTIQKGFKAFKCKFEMFERDPKYSNTNSNYSKGIRSIRIYILIIRKGFKDSNPNLTHSKGIRSIRM